MGKAVEKPALFKALKGIGLICLVFFLMIARRNGSDPLPFGISRDFLSTLFVIIGLPYLVWMISGFFTKPKRKAHSGLLPDAEVGTPASQPVIERLEHEDRDRDRRPGYWQSPYAILVLLIAFVMIAVFALLT